MPATDRPVATADAASDVAAACREASLLCVLAGGDGDGLAAAGLLATACEAVGTPYHVRVVRTRRELAANREAVDEGATTLDVGTSGEVASLDVHAAAAALDAPAPVLALAGVVAAGAVPDAVADDLIADAGLERRPGVAAPTDDPAEALAHTTFAHAPFSGDRETAAEAVDRLDDPADGTRLASLLAIAAAGDDDAPSQAGTAIERALRPYVIDGPVATLGGYADVLDALARTAPGLGLALALGADVRDAALDAWRDHATSAHAAVRSASTARYSGLLVARVDGPVEPTARLLRDFRSPEPAVLAVGDGEAAVAATDESAGDALEESADAVGGSALGRGPRGYARFDPGNEEALVDAVRGAL